VSVKVVHVYRRVVTILFGDSVPWDTISHDISFKSLHPQAKGDRKVTDPFRISVK